MTTGLRDREKRETYRALSQAALELVQDRGLEHVTVPDIAGAADAVLEAAFGQLAPDLPERP